MPNSVAAGIEGRHPKRQKKANVFPVRRRATETSAAGRGKSRAFCRVQNPALSTGVLLGVSFSSIGAIWLLLANRVPYLDHFASERNLALAIAFATLGIVPTCRFIKSPGRNFVCGVTGWAILTAIYCVAELGFPRLATRLGAFHLFVLGCTVFGLLAALTWVVNLVIVFRRVRQRPINGRIGLRYATSSR